MKALILTCQGLFHVLFCWVLLRKFVLNKLRMLDSAEDREIKLLWMQEELSKFGEATVDMLIEEIQKHKMVNTGNLVDSFNYNSFMDHDNPGQRIFFATYGRYVDIGAYRSKTAIDTNRVVWGMKENRKVNKKWYARNMYRLLGRLQSCIMYCLSEEELARLKGILENRKNKNL